MLTNLTNNNGEASKVVAYESGIMSCMKLIGANLGFGASSYSCGVSGAHFDITVNLLGLLINLTEYSISNREELYKSKIHYPNGDTKPFFSWLVDLCKLNVDLSQTTLRKVLTSGKKVENFVVSSYAVLLIGCCIKDHPKNRKTFLKMIKKDNFDEFVKVLEQFLSFKSTSNILFKEELDGINNIIKEFQKK